MDKRVVFAVAGSGKSSEIINRIKADSRALVVTYTENNTKQLKRRIIQKFGFIPEGVRVYTYFTFLYSFCFRPLFSYELGIKGISFQYPNKRILFSKKNSREHYIDTTDRIYHHRIAKLILESGEVRKVSERIEKFFDLVLIDEIQDFAANDFNLLCELAKTDVSLLLVGDFYQHTFKTSIDGNVQKNLHSDFERYCQQLVKAGYELDLDMLSHSYRCSPTLCEYVSNEIGIAIASHRTDEVEVKELVAQPDIECICNDDAIIKLFYQNSNKYSCYSDNWGATKGLDDFDDVCVVLNASSLVSFRKGELHKLATTTRNKLYVACTRAKKNLYFVDEKLLKGFKR